MLCGMRAFLLSALFVLPALATAQQNCSSVTDATVMRQLHATQQKALSIKASEMDSGVPVEAVVPLRNLKRALAQAADAVVGCQPPAIATAQLSKLLNSRLRAAAPGLPTKQGTELGSDAPSAGAFGNDVAASVRLFPGAPDLLAVELSSTVTCGTDSQLLVYSSESGRWVRQLRWSADFKPSKDEVASAWGDSFLFDILRVPAAPSDWHVVAVHGTPWCTSRFSGFDIAVLRPARSGADADVVWQTDRGYSRGDYATRLKILAPDTFEVRVHADEMTFNEEGFERLVVYRYRLHDSRVTRLQPVAANARGFVEEWLSMPWSEAEQSSDGVSAGALHNIHDRYENSYSDSLKKFTTWAAGPVQACLGGQYFQVAFDSERSEVVPGNPGGNQSDRQHYYFRLGATENGYRMLSVSTAPEKSCSGPDLMQKHTR